MNWNCFGYTISILAAPMLHTCFLPDMQPAAHEDMNSTCVSECVLPEVWERKLQELPYLQQSQHGIRNSEHRFSDADKIEILNNVVQAMLLESEDLDQEFAEIINRRFAEMI